MRLINSDPLEPTIFHESWWLNVVASEGFDEVKYFDNGKLVGRFPFIVERSSFGRTLCRSPRLAYFLGPAIDAGTGAACNRRLRHDQIMKELLCRMPHTSGFSHSMHAGIIDLLIFNEIGFKNCVQFTFEIDPSSSEKIWLDMRDKTRNAIRGAEKKLRVLNVVDVEHFVSFYQDNILHAGYNPIFLSKDLISVCAAAISRDRGKIIAARSNNGNIEAAIMYLWDSKNFYYFLSTRTASAHNGAVSLLIWTAIKECSELGLVFDFHGVGTYGGRLFYNGFGGRVTPRYTVFRFNKWFRSVELAERLLRCREKSRYIT